MVYLDKIYTKSGDAGKTSLGNGTRVSKTDQRVCSYGCTDELNSIIGVALALGIPLEPATILKRIQNDLFDLGADLCLPDDPPNAPNPPLRVTECHVELLEQEIDRVNELLSPLTSFVLPGGSQAAAHLHHARTVCRRAEIELFRLMEIEEVNPLVATYLNRLSDLLFVLARSCNGDGTQDVLWKPGHSVSDEKHPTE